MSEQDQPLRILLHPVTDARLLKEVAGVLKTAVKTHPEHFDKVFDREGIQNHYGYHTPTLSATVLVKESWGNFYRLTIRRGEHEVFRNLAALILNQIGDLP